MRKFTSFVFIGILLLVLQLKTTAQVHINVINSWGYNIINFEELMGVPYWDKDNPATSTQITDDSPFVYKGGVQATFDVADKIRLGGELSTSRLYYVEERYSVQLIDTEYRWRTYDIWTLNIEGISQFFLTRNIYLQAGTGVHYFFNGSGIALGAMGGIGYEIPFTEKISIPVEFRNDWIFGEATSGIFSLGVGLMLNL